MTNSLQMPCVYVCRGHTGAEAEEDDSEVERLLQQVADARHAGDRRDAMSQLSSLLPDNPRVRPPPAVTCTASWHAGDAAGLSAQSSVFMPAMQCHSSRPLLQQRLTWCVVPVPDPK